LNRDLDWNDLAAALVRQPHLVQLALRRQPWNAEEAAAGGVVEVHPEDFTECTDGDATWLEHTRFFTTNPSIYRRDLCSVGWPSGTKSEGIFSVEIVAAHPDWRFAYWGARDSGEWCLHIGNERVGMGY
jgi:hypothetical protein